MIMVGSGTYPLCQIRSDYTLLNLLSVVLAERIVPPLHQLYAHARADGILVLFPSVSVQYVSQCGRAYNEA